MDTAIKPTTKALVRANDVIVDLRLESYVVDSLRRDVSAYLYTSLYCQGGYEDQQCKKDYYVDDDGLEGTIATIPTDYHLIRLSDASIHHVFFWWCKERN